MTQIPTTPIVPKLVKTTSEVRVADAKPKLKTCLSESSLKLESKKINKITDRYQELFLTGKKETKTLATDLILAKFQDDLNKLTGEQKSKTDKREQLPQLCLSLRKKECKCKKECTCDDDNYLVVKKVKSDMCSNCKTLFEFELNDKSYALKTLNKCNLRFFKLGLDAQETELFDLVKSKEGYQLIIYCSAFEIKEASKIVFEISDDPIMNPKLNTLTFMIDYMNYDSS